MLIKICGLCDYENILSISALKPDFLGFIFVKTSPRYAGARHLPGRNSRNASICRVGIFCNQTCDEILETVTLHELDGVQLHGGESRAFCAGLKRHVPNVQIIKTLHLEQGISDDQIEPYADTVDYFLLDSGASGSGGSGKLLSAHLYANRLFPKPTLLGGGIGPEVIEQIRKVSPSILGVDVNSVIEDSPGIKNVARAAQIIKEVRNDIYSRK